MKRIATLLLIIMTAVSCQKDRATDCEPRPCSMIIFHDIKIKFVDKNGAPAEVYNYSVINQRTGEKIKVQTDPTSNPVPGVFVVITQRAYASTDKLSDAGDDLKITGTSVATKQTKTATIKVAGGKCACSITKISGPEQISFD